MADAEVLINGVTVIGLNYGAPVQTVAALSNISINDRTDKQQRLVEDVGFIYFYDSASTTADADGPPPITVDTDGVVLPNDNPVAGRWLKIRELAGAVDHNLLAGLQGGSSSERYHLSAAESVNIEHTTNKNAANGYAGLSAGSKLTGSQQVYGTGPNTAAQGNDERFRWWEMKAPAEAAQFITNASLGAPTWNASDRESYIAVTASSGTDRLAALVYEFVIPSGATSLSEVMVVGKLGVANQDVINIRVKDESGTQIASTTITAATATAVALTSFSPTPDLTAGRRIFVEVEGQVDSGETVFLGRCRILFSRS